jgi:hypothetical protein
MKAQPERSRLLGRVERRAWPLGISIVFVTAGLLYCFRLASVFQHDPSLWWPPGDLDGTYSASAELAQGHFNLLYQIRGVNEFPGSYLLFAPIAAFNSALHTTIVQIFTPSLGTPVHPAMFTIPSTIANVLNVPRGLLDIKAGYFVSHPQWALVAVPYALVVSCVALFAFDALAEHLKISRHGERHFA